jgi:YgiT-type zinc finger domain-containing protein
MILTLQSPVLVRVWIKVSENGGKMWEKEKELPMKKEKLQEKWQGISEDLIIGMSEWREKHPRATLREIEEEIDRRMSVMRARMIADTAMNSVSAEWEAGERVVCPQCGGEMLKKGKKKRKLQTRGGREVELEREYGICLDCGHGFFPPR